MNGKRHGKGVSVRDNGWVYIGDCKDGKMDGNGEDFWSDGSHYVGQFKNDKFNGQGRRQNGEPGDTKNTVILNEGLW